MEDLPKLKDGEVVYSTDKKEIKRLTFSLLINQAFSFFNFEKGYLNSIYLLIKNPGKHIRAYLSIQRERLINPFKFYFISGSIYAFVFLKLFNTNKDKMESEDISASEFKSIFLDFIHIWFLVFVVFITLYSYLFFKKSSGYNLVENLIFNLYVMAVILIVSSILSPLELIFEYQEIILNLIPLLYFIYAYISFFKGNYFKTTFLLFLSLILGVITLAVTIVFVGIIYGFFQAV